MAEKYEVYEYGNGAVRVHIPSFLMNVEKEADLAMLRAVGENAQIITDAVRGAAPRRTGNLANAIMVTDVLPYGNHRVAIRFFFDEKIAPYWRWVVYGRHPDTTSKIVPISGKALAFPSGSGLSVFSNVAKSIVEPNPFVREAMRSALVKFTGKLATDFVAFLRR